MVQWVTENLLEVIGYLGAIIATFIIVIVWIHNKVTAFKEEKIKYQEQEITKLKNELQNVNIPQNQNKGCVVILQNRSERDVELGHPSKRVLNAKKEIWLSGLTLNVAKSGDWRGFEDGDAKIKVLLPNYKNNSVVFATAQLNDRTTDEEMEMIKISCEYFLSKKREGKNIELRLLDYSPSYSVFSVDPKETHNKGYISIEFTGYHYIPSEAPNFTLYRSNKKHNDKFNQLIQSWEVMWDDAVEYS